jgi:hypothetical protein
MAKLEADDVVKVDIDSGFQEGEVDIPYNSEAAFGVRVSKRLLGPSVSGWEPTGGDASGSEAPLYHGVHGGTPASGPDAPGEHGSGR